MEDWSDHWCPLSFHKLISIIIILAPSSPKAYWNPVVAQSVLEQLASMPYYRPNRRPFPCKYSIAALWPIKLLRFNFHLGYFSHLAVQMDGYGRLKLKIVMSLDIVRPEIDWMNNELGQSCSREHKLKFKSSSSIRGVSGRCASIECRVWI